MISWSEADVSSSRFRSSTHLMLLLHRAQNVLIDTHPPALASGGVGVGDAGESLHLKTTFPSTAFQGATAENSTPDVAEVFVLVFQ